MNVFESFPKFRAIVRGWSAGLTVGLACIAGAQTVESPALTDEQRAALYAVARSEPGVRWPGLTPDQRAGLEGRAEEFLAMYQQDHQPYGQHADLWWSAYDRSHLHSYDHIGDSSTWLGHHLAGLCYRYAVTKDAETLAAIGRILDTFDMLVEITGRSGYIARFAAPKDDPAYRQYYHAYGRGPDAERPGLGTWAYEGAAPRTDYVWLGNSSRDIYIGTFYGLGTVLRVIDDEAMRSKVASLVERILDRLTQDEWTIYDPDNGHRTRITPQFRAMWWRVGATINPDKYQAQYDEFAAAFMAGPAPAVNRYTGDYFANNLRFVGLHTLITLETDAAKRANYAGKLEAMWAEARDHLSAWFGALYIDVTGNLDDPYARAAIEAGLYEFWRPRLWMVAVSNSTRDDIEFVEAGGRTHAKYALPVRDRALSDFLWQRSPFRLDHDTSAPYEFPGLDFYVPYWLGRYAGALTAPTGN